VPDERPLETLTAADFHGAVGSRFLLTAPSPDRDHAISFDVELVDVSEQAAIPGLTFRAPFSLIFHGPLEPVLPQATYRLEQERVGAFEVFAVPIGPPELDTPGQAPTAMRYQVVFG
jgi:hypothetical protein